MVYENSYENGRKPFNPDTTRGYWAQPSDFVFICMALAFKLDFFFIPMTFFIQMGIGVVLPYLFCIALYVVPIMVIQSFMGQFSSSGFISAFRMSPFFKGIGYISLALNFLILSYYCIFVTIPMTFVFNSFRPKLPWSCEFFMNETESNTTAVPHTTLCMNSEVKKISRASNETLGIIYELPSVLYFNKEILDFSDEMEDFSFSWQLFGCTLITWSIISAIFYKFSSTDRLGKLLRYAIWITLFMLLLCIVRFTFLPGTINALNRFTYIEPNLSEFPSGILNILVYTMLAFGPGWGSIISLSSFNNFNANIMRYSWIISIGQMIIFMAFNYLAMLVDSHFSAQTDVDYYNFIENHWDMYLASASAIANLNFPHLWSILFYSMLTMTALIVITTQLHTLLTTIFDEFEYLREFKLRVTFIFIALLGICSIYLCTNQGITYFSTLSVDTLFTKTALNLLLLLIVLWIYGRERLQRDIEFMLNQPFATWKVNMLRFVAPLCLLLILLFSILLAIYTHLYSTTFVHVVAILFILLPWISIPGYGLFTIIHTTGPLLQRIRRSCRPTDWYPVEQENRQRYEEAVGNENITHQLSVYADKTGNS